MQDRADPARRRTAARRALLAAASLLLASLALPRAGGAVDAARVKGAFLYNFAKFVRWPPEALAEGEPLLLCVLADEATHEGLASTVEGKAARGHPIRTRALAQPEEGRSCHIVFVAEGAGVPPDALAAALEGRSVLTVGESEGFARRGGMIRFLREENKLRFAVNPRAAARARLGISSRLLRLARVVRE